jgi:protein subunit release factor A
MSEIKVITEMKREKIFSVNKKDFKITWFGGTGAGGQHRNKHHNCCRIVHEESGAMATGQESRHRNINQQNAFKRLVKSDKFQLWLRIECSLKCDIIDDATAKVDEMLRKNEIRTEVMSNKHWKETKELD